MANFSPCAPRPGKIPIRQAAALTSARFATSHSEDATVSGVGLLPAMWRRGGVGEANADPPFGSAPIAFLMLVSVARLRASVLMRSLVHGSDERRSGRGEPGRDSHASRRHRR